MTELIQPFLVPAVLVAAITLFVQGVVGILNTALQMRAGTVSKAANQINYVVSVLELIDSLPLNTGQKTVAKIDIARKLLPQGLPKELDELLDKKL